MFAAHAGYAPPESICDAQRRAGTRFRRGVKDLKGLDFSAGRAARQKIARFPSDNGGRRFPHKGAVLRGPAEPDARAAAIFGQTFQTGRSSPAGRFGVVRHAAGWCAKDPAEYASPACLGAGQRCLVLQRKQPGHNFPFMQGDFSIIPIPQCARVDKKRRACIAAEGAVGMAEQRRLAAKFFGTITQAR